MICKSPRHPCMMGTLGTLGSTMIKTNLFWVLPHQLTQSVPTLKLTLITHSKKKVFGEEFDLKKPLLSDLALGIFVLLFAHFIAMPKLKASL
jgi:hypothetical protein